MSACLLPDVAVAVTGRYYVHALVDAFNQCRQSTMLAVESPEANFDTELTRGRQETMVLGFDTRWADFLFGWSHVGAQCQECHVTRFTRTLRLLQSDARMVARRMPNVTRGTERASSWLTEALCDLPLMDVDPVIEGSTGKLRSVIRR
jgi:hypothetical protein